MPPVAEVWRRLAERPDSEHEQVVIRCAIALLAFTYLAAVAAFGTGERSLAIHCLPLAVAYVLGSTLLLAHLLWQPGSRPARRYAGMTLDMLTLTVALTLGEGTSAIFYPFYLWVTLGMGFRYGRRYLYVSALMSLVSFATVILITDFWHRQPALAAGLWAALLMLPAYSASLLAKLTDAVERAEAASRAKSRFLATMSHELRTPLNAIIGITDLLRAGRLDGEQSELVRTARLAGQNLLDMINDVLDVAKIESGKATIELVEFDLHVLLCRVRSLLLPRAQSQGLYLNLTIDPAAPYRLRGGERALQQVLTNLVANGIITKPVSAATLLAAVDRITAAGGTPAAPAADPALARASNVLLHPCLASDVPALDRSHFQHLRQLDQGDGFFVTVAHEFLADAGQLVVELQAAAAAGDIVTFRDRAHALRSSAAHMGARAIFELCLAWRGISGPELRAGSKTFAARLTTEFERMRNELLAEIEPARGQGTRRADAAKQVRRPQR
jgi:signal transduction histidine kinase